MDRFVEYLKNYLRILLPKRLYTRCCTKYYSIQLKISELRYSVTSRRDYLDPFKVPIIINNYNRLSCLQKLIVSLEDKGYSNIYIIDNNSDYPPLLEFYRNCTYEIFYLSNNLGFRALWESGIYKRFKRSYYVYTDPDMEVMEDCPADFMAHFIDIFDRYPKCAKVGFGIYLDDIPDTYEYKEKVLAHETIFWRYPVEKSLYQAGIDTTFALYRPYTKGASSPYKLMFRTGAPYLVRHLPWYSDTHNLTQEEVYYLQSVNQSTHWSKIMAQSSEEQP